MNRSFFQLLTCLTLSLFVLSFAVEAQSKKTTIGKTAGPKVVATKPGVYITFERFGKRMPLRDDESGEGVFLRLHNNMVYSIRVCGFGISEDGERLAFYVKGRELGINYEVERMPSKTHGGSNSEEVNRTEEMPETPIGYKVGGVCHVYTLPSNQTLLFSVPREHLAKNLSVKIQFGYEWEGDYSSRWDEPEHYVRFYSSSLPEKTIQP